MTTGITVTGNDRIDTATAEIAAYIRDAGQMEPFALIEAMRLRDEIINGLVPHYHSATGEENRVCWCKNPATYAAPVTGRSNPWGNHEQEDDRRARTGPRPVDGVQGGPGVARGAAGDRGSRVLSHRPAAGVVLPGHQINQGA
jgi:hypothetical protein